MALTTPMFTTYRGYATEFQPVMQGRDIGQPATDAIQRLNHDDVVPSTLGIGQEGLVTWSRRTRARDRSVLVAAHQLPVLLVDIAPADLELVLDRTIALPVGAEPRVDHRSHHLPSPTDQFVQDRSRPQSTRRHRAASRSSTSRTASSRQVIIGATAVLSATLSPSVCCRNRPADDRVQEVVVAGQARFKSVPMPSPKDIETKPGWDARQIDRLRPQ